MKFFQDTAQEVITRGFTPVLNRGTILMLMCPQCHKVKMGKFVFKRDRRLTLKACRCGYREASRKALVILGPKAN